MQGPVRTVTVPMYSTFLGLVAVHILASLPGFHGLLVVVVHLLHDAVTVADSCQPLLYRSDHYGLHIYFLILGLFLEEVAIRVFYLRVWLFFAAALARASTYIVCCFYTPEPHFPNSSLLHCSSSRSKVW